MQEKRIPVSTTHASVGNEDTAMQGLQKIDAQTADTLPELTQGRPIVRTDIGVEFDEGPVTLAGTIAIWAKQIADEQAAQPACEMFDADEVTVETQDWDEL